MPMRKKIITWLIAKYLPGYHLAKNPDTKGVKRPRKKKVTSLFKDDDDSQSYITGA